MTVKIEGIAQAKMRAGFNCCQAVLLACGEVYELTLPPELLSAAKLFGGGMRSGCVCGALTGLVMAAGLLQEKQPHKLADDLAAHLHRRFQEEFDTACCRELRKNMPLWKRTGNKGCRELTGKAARILCELWPCKNDAKERSS